MPRHNGGGGVPGHPAKPRGGKLSRRTRGPSTGYDPTARRADWQHQEGRRPARVRTATIVVPVPPRVDMGRKNGSATTPQQPKPTTKGGSKPKETNRDPKPTRRVTRAAS